MILPIPKIGDRFDTLEVVDVYMASLKFRRVVLLCAQCGFKESMDFRTFHERQGNINRENKKKIFCPCCSNIGFIRGTAKIIGIVKTNTTASDSIYKIQHSCCGAHEEITKRTLIKRSAYIKRGCRFCNKRLAECHKRFQNTGRNTSPIYIPFPIELPEFIRLDGGPIDIPSALVSLILSRSGL